MARPGLRVHPKFKRLIGLLRMSEAHVLGHLQLLWETSYEHGEAIGDHLDVELAAGWEGEPGRLCSALVTCGGPGKSGFIEEIPGELGRFRIHDLFDHAPTFVQRRLAREAERIKKGHTISDIRRAAAKEMHRQKREKQADADDIQLLAEGVQKKQMGRTPSPSPSPSTGSEDPVHASTSPALGKGTRKQVPPRVKRGGPNTILPENLQPMFWNAIKANFPGDKIANPTAAAEAYAAVVASGQITGQELNGCIARYRATFPGDRLKFMVQAHAWLGNHGFMAFLEAERRGDPISAAESAVAGPVPMHKRALSAEDQAYLEQMP